MCLALVLVVASVSSVNLALTGISLDLGTTSSQLTWIADGYTVALAALVLPFGALGDRFGRRTLLLVGTVVFGLGVARRGGGTVAGALIGCRVVMGVGAAMIMPGTLSTITAVFPVQAQPGGERLGRLRQLGRDPRAADLRADPRVVHLAGDLRRHRGPRRGRLRRGPGARPEHVAIPTKP